MKISSNYTSYQLRPRFSGHSRQNLLSEENLDGVVNRLQQRIDENPLKRDEVREQISSMILKETEHSAKEFWANVSKRLFSKPVLPSNNSKPIHSSNSEAPTGLKRLSKIPLKAPEQDIFKLFKTGSSLAEYHPPEDLPKVIEDKDVVQGVADSIKSAASKDSSPQKYIKALGVNYIEAEGDLKDKIKMFWNSVAQNAFGKPLSELLTLEKQGFDGVYGLEKEKQKLRKNIITAIDYNLNPHNYPGHDLNLKWPNGVIFHGLPGTGKSFMSIKLAEQLRKLSGEHKWPYIPVPYREITTKMEGDAVKNIGEFFKKAEEEAPSVLFLDEFDSFASQKNAKGEDRQGTVETNEILTQVDKASEKKVLVIAACNDISRLEKAAKRTGRFKERLLIPPLDQTGRTEFFKQTFIKVNRGQSPFKDEDYSHFATLTRGFSADDITDVINNTYLGILDQMREHQIDIPLTVEKVVEEIKDKSPSYSDDELQSYSID